MKPLDRYSCEEVFRRLDDYVDRELSADEVRKVEEHLATCAECTSEYRFEINLLSELKERLNRITAPAALLETISAAIDRFDSLDGADPRRREHPV